MNSPSNRTEWLQKPSINSRPPSIHSRQFTSLPKKEQMGHGAMSSSSVTWVPFLTWPHLDGITAAQVSSPHQESWWKYPHAVHVSFFCICVALSIWDPTFYIWHLVHVVVLLGLVFLVFFVSWWFNRQCLSHALITGFCSHRPCLLLVVPTIVGLSAKKAKQVRFLQAPSCSTPECRNG